MCFKCSDLGVCYWMSCSSWWSGDRWAALSWCWCTIGWLLMMGRPYCTTLTRANSALRRTMSPRSPSPAFPFSVWKVWAVKSWHSFSVWKVQVSGCGLHKWVVESCGLGKVSPVGLHRWVLWAYTGEFWAYTGESSRLVQVICGLQIKSYRSTQIVLWSYTSESCGPTQVSHVGMLTLLLCAT